MHSSKLGNTSSTVCQSSLISRSLYSRNFQRGLANSKKHEKPRKLDTKTQDAIVIAESPSYLRYNFIHILVWGQVLVSLGGAPLLFKYSDLPFSYNVIFAG